MLLTKIDKALQDNNISFVSTKLEGNVKNVSIVFKNMNDKDFISTCYKENERIIKKAIQDRDNQIYFEQFLIKINSKNLPIKQLKPIQESDFTFEAHKDIVLFIQQVNKIYSKPMVNTLGFVKDIGQNNRLADIEKLRYHYQKIMDSSINELDVYLSDDIYSYKEGFMQLSNWLISEPMQDYCKKGHCVAPFYKEYLDDPIEAEGLLSNIIHALIDDGEIGFVSIKVEEDFKKFYIVHRDRFDKEFKKQCREENKEFIENYIKKREEDIANGSDFKELKTSDFVFRVHRDPLLFIKQVNKHIQHLNISKENKRKIKP